MEIGITGGEEDGVDNTGADMNKLYTQPEQVGVISEVLCDVLPFPQLNVKTYHVMPVQNLRWLRMGVCMRMTGGYADLGCARGPGIRVPELQHRGSFR